MFEIGKSILSVPAEHWLDVMTKSWRGEVSGVNNVLFLDLGAGEVR